MKITGATSLVELQRLVRDSNLSIRVHYTGSAACYSVLVVGPSKVDETEAATARAIGRTLGEAVAKAVELYEETR